MWDLAKGINQCNGKYLIWGKSRDLCPSYFYAVALEYQYFFPLKKLHFPEDRDRKAGFSWGWLVTDLLSAFWALKMGEIGNICFYDKSRPQQLLCWAVASYYPLGDLLAPQDWVFSPQRGDPDRVGSRSCALLALHVGLTLNSIKVISSVSHQEKWPHFPPWAMKSRGRMV